jgi:hypothetical protein
MRKSAFHTIKVWAIGGCNAQRLVIITYFVSRDIWPAASRATFIFVSPFAYSQLKFFGPPFFQKRWARLAGFIPLC